MEIIQLVFKQFVAWGTALRDRYKHDVFFRTITYIVLVQIGIVIVALLFFVTGKVLIGILCIALAFGVVAAYFPVFPARGSLEYQKLFISNVAHELRTPLSVIKTSTEVLLFDKTVPQEIKRTLESIIEELDRISEIINNLLSLNRLMRPERMGFTSVDLGPIIDATVVRLRSLAVNKNIEMIVKKDDYRMVWGNSTALEQIVSNLIRNAILYTPETRNSVITISVTPDYQGSIIFSVVDNGIGIPQKDLFHILEPFYRADDSRTREVSKVGSGLGLAIVNEIVRVHHGRIKIRSGVNKGTTVTITIPAANDENNPEYQKHLMSTSGFNEVSADFSHQS